MRFAIVTIFVLLIAAVAFAKPAKSTPPNSCTRVCPTNYEPVCAKAKNGNKERLLTFGSDCVMSNYNCDHTDDPYEKKSNGECGNKVSVRLQ
ncbi:vasotab [Episyrphus balteatus]|uniref:vasotab n=1 Tax=Episyrphus balteatus TaxID=286459 RepID=UPI002485023B|nr:vasotab [Episyrphus balteatus]